MKLTPFKRTSLALALAWCSWTTQAADYSGVVIFGDSLSDGGTYGSRFTTNPGQTAAEYIAEGLGFPTTTWAAGGTNFAQGGQKVNSDSLSTPAGAPQRPISTQVAQYLGATGGKANPNTVYLIQGGANDIFQNLAATGAGAMTPAQLQAATYQSGVDFATQVAKLQQAGAKYIVVQNVPNIGAAPAFSGDATSAAFATQVAQGYNSTVSGALQQMGVQAVMLDDYALLTEILAQPAAYGFSNATGVACTTESSITCSPATLVSPDAATTYVFADDVHPTTAAQKLLAQYALSAFNAPAQMSMLGSVPVQGARQRSEGVWSGVLNNLQTGAKDWHVFGDIGHSKMDYDQAQNKANYVLIGADKKIGSAGDNRLGASLAYQKYKGTFGADAGDFSMNETSVGVHFSHKIGDKGTVLTQASYGRLTAKDITRQIMMGSMVRSETADSKGRHFSIGAQGEMNVGSFVQGRVTHGLIGRVSYEDVRIDGFSESGISSTAMTFEKQTRSGVLADFGYQVQGRFGQLMPYAKLSYEIDSTSSDGVSARLNSASSGFTTPALQTDNRTRATLGARVALAKDVNLNMEAQRTLGANVNQESAFHLGVSARF